MSDALGSIETESPKCNVAASSARTTSASGFAAESSAVASRPGGALNGIGMPWLSKNTPSRSKSASKISGSPS